MCLHIFQISVSHHVGYRLVRLDMWYLNAIRHQDGCRLVHPAKWDISSIPYAIMIDVDWCILPSGTLDNFGVPSRQMPIGESPPGCSFGILIQFKMSRIDQFDYNSINLSHVINHQSFQLSHFKIHMHFRNIISKIYSFHIIISDLFGIVKPEKILIF